MLCYFCKVLNLTVAGILKIEIIDASYHLDFSRYTSKGANVYAIITAKPPKPTVQLLVPKTSATTKVNGQYCLLFL